MKINKLVCILSVFLLAMAATASGVSAVTMDVGETSGEATATLQIPIIVNVSTGIAGAAFTITYDPDKITLTDVQSPFFGTFAQQWVGTPNAASAPPSVTIDPDSVPNTGDEVTYTQPLLINDIATGTMIAAARCTPGPTGSNTTLFTLSFVLNSGVRSGTYPVGIASSVIDNTAAGYDVGGETIPMLIGADASLEPTNPLAYPVKLDPVHSIGSVTPGSVTFSYAGDSDGDNIPDDWEMNNFGNLTTANETTDTDLDGYLDIQEFLNDGTNDPNSVAYDPNVKNAQGGTGYNSATDWRTVSFSLTKGWNLVSLPVTPSNGSLSALFPSASVAYEYNGTNYISTTTLVPGKGYWVNMPNAGVYNVTGLVFTKYTSSCNKGWNLMGAVYGTATPSTSPSGQISVMYRYNGVSYQAITGNVNEKDGFWVFMLNACSLTVNDNLSP